MVTKLNRSASKHIVTLIHGDGVGPEIAEATKEIVNASGANIEWEVCQAGASVFAKGIATGVPKETIDSITKNKVALKGPLATPVGYGEKSANVTLRKTFETYGNIRPAKEFKGVPTPYQGRGVDLIIVRENLEDLYSGIEYGQTPNVAMCLKLISRQECEKISRLAFEVARAEGRKKVHCATKANIMKMTEGLLKRTFEEVAKDYPEIESQHIIVDNCAHQLVKKPEQFEVIVMTNMNGDILSDLSSALIGGLGFAPSANIGDHCAIFEAVHGSAPKYAGLNQINPTALILSSVMMLRHLNEFDAAFKIEQALQDTLARGIITRDVVGGMPPVSTSDFTKAILQSMEEFENNRPAEGLDINALGIKSPGIKTPGIKAYRPIDLTKVYYNNATVAEHKTVGVDVFIENKNSLEVLVADINGLIAETNWHLYTISSRGLVIYPNNKETTDGIEHLCCRFLLNGADLNAKTNTSPGDADANIGVLINLIQTKYRWVQIERLQSFDGINAFAKTDF